MVIQLNVAQPLDKLTPIECPKRGGINFACAPCQQCEIGEVTLTSGPGYLIENTVNSILIHLELGIQDDDPLEESALKFLKASMSDKFSFIQKGGWELGDFQILITDDMTEDKDLINKIQTFVQKFPGQFRQLMIGAKRAMTNWSDSQAKQLSHKYFRGV